MRHEDDFYATPRWAVDVFLEALEASDGFERWGLVVEPGCGDGAVLEALAARKIPRSSLLGIELDEERAATSASKGFVVEREDFLTFGGTRPPISWVVGNPPFRHAQAFVEHALSLVEIGGRVSFLLRLAFLASKRRAPLFESRAGFARLDVLSRRPSFTPERNDPRVGPTQRHKRATTDKYDYGWFTWERGFDGDAVVRRLK